jgi:hypothetical protein
MGNTDGTQIACAPLLDPTLSKTQSATPRDP